MNKPFWDTDRLKLLEELWVKNDLSTAAIARRLETTKGSILGKAHRMGLAERHPKRTSYTPQHKPPVDRIAAPVPEAPVAPPPPMEPVEQRPENGFLLLKLKPHHCRWPISGDPRKGEEYRFCGEARVGGKVMFCEEHAKRAFNIWPPK